MLSAEMQWGFARIVARRGSPSAGDRCSIAQPLGADKPASYASEHGLLDTHLAAFPVGLALFSECFRTLDRVLAVGHR